MIQLVLSEPAWLNQMASRDMDALTPLLTNYINPAGQFDLDMETRYSFAFINASVEPQSDFTNSIAPLCSKNVGTRSRRYFASMYLPGEGTWDTKGVPQRRPPSGNAFGGFMLEYFFLTRNHQLISYSRPWRHDPKVFRQD
jgi:hypothetical protein